MNQVALSKPLENEAKTPYIWRFFMKLIHGIDRFLNLSSFNEIAVLKGYLRKRILQFARNPVVVPTRYGFDMLVDPGEKRIIEKAIYCSGTYEAGTIHILDQCLRAGDTFLDVGANIGLMSLYAARKVGISGSVYAFEPQVESYRMFNRNIEINSIGNIRTYQVGIGASGGTATLYRNTTVGRGADSFIPETPETPVWEEAIEIYTLDDFVNEHQINTVRMIKIDVEGWEYEVLKGAQTLLSSPDAPILCVECSLRRANTGSPEEIFNFLKSVNRYMIYKPLKGKGKVSTLVDVKTIEDLPHHDNLFCFTPQIADNLPKSLFQTSTL